MNSVETQLRQSRRTIQAALGLVVLCAAALIVLTSALNSATDAVVSGSGSVGVDAGGEPTMPVLGNVEVPPAPGGCPSELLTERTSQLALLDQERAAEAAAISTVTDAGLSDKLRVIRDRADVILGRIRQINDRCRPDSGSAPAAAPVDETNEAMDMMEPDTMEPAGSVAAESGVPGEVDIACAEPDLSAVGPAAAARTVEQLARNETRIEARLAGDRPQFAAHPGRGAGTAQAPSQLARFADNQVEVLETRRTAILQRAGLTGAAEAAATCEVVGASG